MSDIIKRMPKKQQYWINYIPDMITFQSGKFRKFMFLFLYIKIPGGLQRNNFRCLWLNCLIVALKSRQVLHHCRENPLHILLPDAKKTTHPLRLTATHFSRFALNFLICEHTQDCGVKSANSHMIPCLLAWCNLHHRVHTRRCRRCQLSEHMQREALKQVACAIFHLCRL